MEKRIVKFRAKKVGSDEWVYGTPFTKLENEFTHFNAMHTCDATGYWGMVMIQPETLGQYSGFEDYYEGDRLSLVDVQGTPWTGNIVFQEGMFALEWQDDSILPLAWALNLCKEAKIIGTVWDAVEEGVE